MSVGMGYTDHMDRSNNFYHCYIAQQTHCRDMQSSLNSFSVARIVEIWELQTCKQSRQLSQQVRGA